MKICGVLRGDLWGGEQNRRRGEAHRLLRAGGELGELDLPQVNASWPRTLRCVSFSQNGLPPNGRVERYHVGKVNKLNGTKWVESYWLL